MKHLAAGIGDILEEAQVVLFAWNMKAFEVGELRLLVQAAGFEHCLT